jgi:hypothetical protein
MTTLSTPTLQSRLLRTVGEAVATNPEDVGETIRLGVGIVRELRESVARMRQEIEEGDEARLITESYGALMAAADENLIQLGNLIRLLPDGQGTPAQPFIAELRLLKGETDVFRNRLAEALSLASQPPKPLDWDRLKAESDADFAAGRFTSFDTPEAMKKGLADGD